MNKTKKIRDYDITIGKMPTGEKNLITDVPGVRVGHVTLDEGDLQTGVTAVVPHDGNLFRDKVVAASHVINGFGKSIGLMQVDELGTLETPILLTSTLNVGLVADGLVDYMLEQNPEIGVKTGTVNPVVCECNDAYLHNARGRHVKQHHVKEAIKKATSIFDEGAVGAGRGMSCYHLKGGIGSASRIVHLGTPEETTYTLGILVLANFGERGDLLIDGYKMGHRIDETLKSQSQEKDRGSVIVVMATDAPLSDRQLKRILRRATVGLARTGSYLGTGSGDVVVGFTTSNRVQHFEEATYVSQQVLNENLIDGFFRAAAEATEEAVLNALVCAEPVTGLRGHRRESLAAHMGLL